MLKRTRGAENVCNFVSFMDLEKADDRVNMEMLGQVLRMYELGSKV